MARRKEQPKYDAAQLRELKAALIEHGRKLIAEIQAKAGNLETFDDAIELRDLTQTLSSTMLSSSNIDTCIKLAEYGEPQTLMSMSLDECGLTWPAVAQSAEAKS